MPEPSKPTKRIPKTEAFKNLKEYSLAIREHNLTSANKIREFVKNNNL